MKRIEAILSGNMPGKKRAENRMKRVENFLDIARLNTEEEIMEAQAELDKVNADFAAGGDEKMYIQLVSYCLRRLDNRKDKLNHLNKVKAYLEEGIKTDADNFQTIPGNVRPYNPAERHSPFLPEVDPDSGVPSAER